MFRRKRKPRHFDLQVEEVLNQFNSGNFNIATAISRLENLIGRKLKKSEKFKLEIAAKSRFLEESMGE